MQDNVNIDKSQFEFISKDQKITDIKLDTKPVGYMKDVWNRFKKNKASVVAATIIILLLLYAIIVPWCSPYNVSFLDGELKNALPKLFNAGSGFWDGTQSTTVSQLDLDLLRAKGVEAEWQKNIIKDPQRAGVGTEGKRSPVTKIKKVIYGNEKNSYKILNDTYLSSGFKYQQVPYNDYVKIQEFQNETGVRIIYPMVEYRGNSGDLNAKDANYWFKYTAKSQVTGQLADTVEIQYDEQGNFVPNYSIYTIGSLSNYRAPYDSIRQKGDPGIDANGDVSGSSYAYARLVAVSDQSTPLEQREVIIRVSYYDYFIYKNGIAPKFVFGLTSVGRDLFVCMAYGARLSFILSISIASINLIIGAILGALMGYYGGWLDLIMQRIMDILAAIPFMVTIVLFKLYVQDIVGILGTVFFAFVFTGWLGMADRVRAQFYRFKSHEYVLASRTLGAKDRRLMFRHIFPNAMGTIITGSILVIPGIIFTEATLSYLGIINLEGATMTSLGTLLSNGQGEMQYFPHNIFFPAIFIALLMISFNLFGNGLRDAFNPALRGVEN